MHHRSWNTFCLGMTLPRSVTVCMFVHPMLPRKTLYEKVIGYKIYPIVNAILHRDEVSNQKLASLKK